MSRELPESPNTPASNANQFRALKQERNAPKLLELPSGLFVKVVRPSVSALLRQGKIPASLISAASLQQRGVANLDRKTMEESMKMIDLIVCESVVDPVIVLENANDNQVNVGDLVDDDKNFIWNYVQTGVTAVEKFRRQE